jgi:hypothetical protein
MAKRHVRSALVSTPTVRAVTNLPLLKTIERDQTTEVVVEEGDHERCTHIVLEGDGERGTEEFKPLGVSVAEGAVMGIAVVALCGKRFVPQRDPKRFPICPTCKDIAQQMGWDVPAG